MSETGYDSGTCMMELTPLPGVLGEIRGILGSPLFMNVHSIRDRCRGPTYSVAFLKVAIWVSR